MQTQVLIPQQLLAMTAPASDAIVDSLHGDTMGTTWSVKFVNELRIDTALLQTGIQAGLDEVVAQMSPWVSDSDISRFNRAEANTWHHLPDQFLKVLDYGLFIAEQTQGAYDPAIGELVDLWGFGTQAVQAEIPNAAEIQVICERGNFRRVKIDVENKRCQQAGGVRLDLSSIAKGFGVDQVAYYLSKQGIAHYLVEVGGELRGLGMKPDQQPWWVELERVPNDNQLRHLVALHGLSIATSGDYRRFFTHKGQRYSHTLDPRTGYPVQHDLAAVTVLHAECMIADALATAILALGPDEGMAYAKQLQVAALLVRRCKNEQTGNDEYPISMSPAFIDMMND